LLIYATCTPLAAENEGVVARLVSEDGMQALPQREWLPADLHGLSSNLDETALRLLPHAHAMDGFVVHVLRSRAAAR
jgi:16S rRNA C967 or C1407 C5-methylase (RsmB/RsmF family)